MRRKNAEQTFNRMRAVLLNGYWPFQPSRGYKRPGIKGMKSALVRDEPVASILAEAQRHLAQWTLQPIVALMAEEASMKLACKVSIDVVRPAQAFDAGGRARAFGAMVTALTQAKEAGLDPQAVEDALSFIDWAD